jgi:hypothetical protein
MSAISALFIMCHFGCVLTSMCVVVFVLGLTTSTPRMGLPLTCELSVKTKSRGSIFGGGVWCVVLLLLLWVYRCWCVGVGLVVVYALDVLVCGVD